MSELRARVPGAPAVRLAAAILAGGSALTSALWIAVSAAAPEFIWRGVVIALGHLDVADLVSALLIGLILAFFVEPLMRHLQARIEGEAGPNSPRARPRSALFTAGMAFVFALASVCVHDAMTAFVSANDAEHGAEPGGLAAGIVLTLTWALVPFAITFAWVNARNRWLRIPTGIIAAASAGIAGWVFLWTAPEVATTLIPCLMILVLGYPQVVREPRRDAFVRCARIVAQVAAAWLLLAALIDTVLDLTTAGPFRLYNATTFWMDVRFYLGWTIGLALAPFPFGGGRDGSA